MGVKKQRKNEAKELALLLYDIYREKTANDKISVEKSKDRKE